MPLLISPSTSNAMVPQWQLPRYFTLMLLVRCEHEFTRPAGLATSNKVVVNSIGDVEALRSCKRH
jgi:hypothetical protein